VPVGGFPLYGGVGDKSWPLHILSHRQGQRGRHSGTRHQTPDTRHCSRQERDRCALQHSARQTSHTAGSTGRHISSCSTSSPLCSSQGSVRPSSHAADAAAERDLGLCAAFPCKMGWSTRHGVTATTCRGGSRKEASYQRGQESSLLAFFGPGLWISMLDRQIVVRIGESAAATPTDPCPSLHEGSKFVGIFPFRWASSGLNRPEI